MADECDQSDERIQLGIDQAIAQARSAPYLKPNGKCHFCDECVIGKLLYCSADCRQDGENEDDQLKRLGR
jgi:hypothetical protein